MISSCISRVGLHTSFVRVLLGSPCRHTHAAESEISDKRNSLTHIDAAAAAVGRGFGAAPAVGRVNIHTSAMCRARGMR